MMLEVIAAFVAAVAAAGVAMALRAATRGWLPRWIVPAAAGAGMIGFTVWSEYGWEGRARAGLPPGFVVVEAPRTASVLRPWTYAAPLVERMLVIDLTATRRHPVAGDLALTRLIALHRWRPNAEMRAVIDCAGGRRIDVVDGVVFSESGDLVQGAWSRVPPDDPVLTAACDGG